jgi:hypothetical protein
MCRQSVTPAAAAEKIPALAAANSVVATKAKDPVAPLAACQRVDPEGPE